MRRSTGAWLGVALWLLAGASDARAQDPYEVDIPALTRKWWSVGGHVEARPVTLDLDHESAAYRLRSFDLSKPDTVQPNLQVLLDASIDKGPLAARVRTVGDLGRARGSWQDDLSVYEAYLAWRPGPTVSVDAGKRTLKWGKGYAWNPVAFLDRPKNPDDPALALEGFWTMSADFIRSGRGALQTIAFTPVLVPVSGRVNTTLGRPEGLHAAGRLYLLWRDTDIDVMALAGEGAAPRVGFDVSRNITPAVEMHAEVARIGDAVARTMGADGRVAVTPAPATSVLVGVRFLLSTNTTFVVEHYRNGPGISADALSAFVARVSDAWSRWSATGDSGPLSALAASSQPFLQPTGMRDYLFVRASLPDLFGVVYLNAALTAIVNERDGSFSLTQETTYKAATNLELRSQAGWIAGGRGTDFGERQANLRWEVRARYFF